MRFCCFCCQRVGLQDEGTPNKASNDLNYDHCPPRSRKAADLPTKEQEAEAAKLKNIFAPMATELGKMVQHIEKSQKESSNPIKISTDPINSSARPKWVETLMNNIENDNESNQKDLWDERAP